MTTVLDILKGVMGDYGGTYYLDDLVTEVRTSDLWANLDPEERDRMERNGVREVVHQHLYRQRDDEDHPVWINIQSNGKRLWIHREDANADEVQEYVTYLTRKQESYSESIEYWSGVLNQKRREEARRSRKAA